MIKQLIERTDNNQETVIVELEQTGIDNLVMFQKSIIDLLKHYDYTNYPDPGETIYFAIMLLENLLPNQEQQEQGFKKIDPQFNIPENITDEQTELINRLLSIIKYPKNSGFNKDKTLNAISNTI